MYDIVGIVKVILERESESRVLVNKDKSNAGPQIYTCQYKVHFFSKKRLLCIYIILYMEQRNKDGPLPIKTTYGPDFGSNGLSIPKQLNGLVEA